MTASNAEPATAPRTEATSAGYALHGQRVVIECKDVATLALPQWTAEAQLEAGNDDALVGVVVHKRRGVGDPMQQWVSMTLADLVAVLTGQRADRVNSVGRPPASPKVSTGAVES
jgi:hypothetical protein